MCTHVTWGTWPTCMCLVTATAAWGQPSWTTNAPREQGCGNRDRCEGRGASSGLSSYVRQVLDAHDEAHGVQDVGLAGAIQARDGIERRVEVLQ
eukprot:366476-Chlamydomonas_euryale.AAC.3